MIRMTKNFASGIKMLWQRLTEGTYKIKFITDEDPEKYGWTVEFRQLPFIPFDKQLLLHNDQVFRFKTWNEAHDFATDRLGAHFNIEFFT